MKKRNLMAISAALVLSAGIAWSFALAQAPGAPAARSGGIALIDVTYLFEHLPRFKQSMEEMKADVMQAETSMKAMQQDIRNDMQALEQLRDKPREYKAAEERVAQRQADMAVKINMQKKEFVQREAKIYLTTYTEVQQEVDYFCKNNGVDMVLRFNGDTPKEEQPDTVLAYINRPVVWYGQGRDVTPYILNSMLARQGATGASSTNGAAPFSRR